MPGIAGGAEAGESPRRGKRLAVGPGALVAAAFIGPGTVTTATLAGSGHGVSLLWALAFSVIATIVLQEMAARVALVTGRDLGESVRDAVRSPAGRSAAVALVVTAIAFGNAAYQTGNLIGGALGLEGLFGGGGRWWALAVGGTAFLILWTGRYRVVERTMVALVALMSVVFIATAVAVAPPPPELVRGLIVPTAPADSSGLLVIVGLIGTTVVPYNLFLHSAAVRERWRGAGQLPAARFDLLVSIGVGGMVSMAIVVCAAGAAPGAHIRGAADMAAQLEPLLGRWAGGFFAAGLAAAGLSSAVTAPLAAAYATAGTLGWPADLRHWRFRAVWLAVLAAGMAFAAAGVRAVPAILLAQVANGLLLPATAIFLIAVANRRGVMGDLSNGPALNVVAGVVMAVVVALGAVALLRALG